MALKRKAWRQIQDSFVIGYAFLKDRLLTETEVYEECVQAIRQEGLSDLLKRLNGSYAAVIHEGRSIYLIVDRLRSYPILYSKGDSSYHISDCAEGLMDAIQNKQMLDLAIAELLTSGCLLGNKTLFESTYTVEAGSFVTIQNDNCNITTYFDHIYEKHVDDDSTIIKRSKTILENAFERIFKTVGDRQVVIPLSGGYDSRLIACMCKEFGLKNVICFSYGKKDSWEAEISKKVAKQLGFNWYFVEYTAEVRLNFLKSKDFSDYKKFAGSFNALPHTQDFLAIKFLIENGTIRTDAVVMPGHSGDLLGGSQLPDFSTKLPLHSLIFRNRYRGNALRSFYRNKVLNELYKFVGGIPVCEDIDKNMNMLHLWFIKVLVSNYLVNSARGYEYFGLDWRMPLWENEFAEYWMSVPWNKKMPKSKLYNQFMFETYFLKYGVDFQPPVSVANSNLRNAFSQIRQILPDNMVATARKYKNIIFKKLEKKADINAAFVFVDYLTSINEHPKLYLLHKPSTAMGAAVIDYFLTCKSFVREGNQ